MKTNILFLLDSLRFGGAERQTIDLINRIDTERFVTSICRFRDERHLENTILSDRVAGSYCLHKRGRVDVGLFRRLQNVIRAANPSVIFCVNPYPLPFVHAVRSLSRGRYRIVPVMHSTTFSSPYMDRLMKWVFAPLINRSDSAVFVSRNQSDHWSKRYRIRSGLASIIHNGVDIDHYRPRMSAAERAEARSRLGLGSEDLLLCMCAAFRQEKQQVDLVSAARLLADRGMGIHVMLVGDGVERPAIESRIDATNMRPRVHLAGYREDVREYLEIADIVINSSHAETFSMSILEAMAMGKGMVCTDVGGTAEQIADGVNGFLYRAGDVGALAEKITAAVQGGRPRVFGDRSREIVENSFSVKVMVGRYHQLLERLLSTDDCMPAR